ncbi:eukaryotic translation initiation factor 3 subunit J [Populus alba x Populus x berolinensis]|uniref:Eukaryotic translation initiation factor 3 subunit J n=1 Tax=Populus alba x Populus x berolinensis TaxID=444605 RepID=A0AAD6R261_9ROSI|nr:eukaryotic translation initiation factor 3 subunit J [Populus alba x Populus x berolinensis]
MEDWEDEQVPPLVAKDQPKSKWDDEDVDEDDVKESWEDEDEPDPAPVVKPPPEMAPKKPAVKSTEKKGNTADVVKDQPLDPLAEKLRQQRLVEEADFRSTAELFGKKDDEKSLDSFIPKSESDFSEYAELISHKLRPFELPLYPFTQDSDETVHDFHESRRCKRSFNFCGKKKQLHVGKPGDDLAGDTYDALDDYDLYVICLVDRHYIFGVCMFIISTLNHHD